MKNKLILKKGTKLEEAINLLDLNGNGILPVVDKSLKLIGIITDGDVRKAILNNKLELNTIINKNPFKLNFTSSKSQKINFLKKIHRRHIPLVDDNNKFIDVFSLDEIDFNQKPNWVVIMAGGMGKRLGELTKDIPKPMLKVGDKPMIEHIIDMFISHGFTKFMISVNYKAELIKEYFDDGSKFGIEIKYIEEKIKLGTGGAIGLIDQKLDAPFFVINADVISSLNLESFLDFHNNHDSIATMCVRKESFQIPYGVIQIDDTLNIKNISEKPKIEFLINTGIYVLNPEVINHIPKNEFFDLPDLIKISNGLGLNIKTYELNEFWIDLGKKSDYNFLNEKVKNNLNFNYFKK